jgi:hypothetical protein
MAEPQVLERVGNALQHGTKEVVQVGGDKVTVAAMNSGNIVGGVGLGAAVGLIVAQMEYRAKKRDMRNLLRQELAATQQKKPDEVTNDDIDRLANENKVIAEQVEKNKKERRISVGTIFVATVATAAILTVMTGGFGILATSVFAPLAAYGGAAVLGAKILTSVLIFGAIKKPLSMIAEKAFGIEEKTTFERIAAMAADRTDDRKITKERVMSVFVSANPELEQYIVATYGDRFDKLKVADKEVIITTIGEKLGISKITDDINANRIRATELTFKVEGKMSGVLPTAGEKPKQTMLMTIKERLHQVADHVPGHHHEHDQPQRSFVERVARVPMDQVSHVQRVNDSRAAEAAAVVQR